jgi:hypothetical protein
MPLVAFSVCLDRIEENLLYQAPNGSWWLGCSCKFDTDGKGRTIVAQSISRERCAAVEKGPQVGYWREIGGKPKPTAQARQGLRPGEIQVRCRSTQSAAAGGIPARRRIAPAIAARNATRAAGGR